jgi:hypothetical protein
MSLPAARLSGRHYVDEKDPANKSAYHAINELIHRGDIVGVIGTPSERGAEAYNLSREPFVLWTPTCGAHKHTDTQAHRYTDTHTNKYTHRYAHTRSHTPTHTSTNTPGP